MLSVDDGVGTDNDVVHVPKMKVNISSVLLPCSLFHFPFLFRTRRFSLFMSFTLPLFHAHMQRHRRPSHPNEIENWTHIAHA